MQLDAARDYQKVFRRAQDEQNNACYYCHEPGHYADHCPEKERNDQRFGTRRGRGRGRGRYNNLPNRQYSHNFNGNQDQAPTFGNSRHQTSSPTQFMPQQQSLGLTPYRGGHRGGYNNPGAYNRLRYIDHGYVESESVTDDMSDTPSPSTPASTDTQLQNQGKA
jgi:hypothetical protein